MKKVELRSKSIGFILLFLIQVLTSTAQPGTNIQKLQENADRLRVKWEAQQQRVQEYARRTNAMIRQEFPDGRIIEMVDIQDGRPLYYTTTNIDAAYTTRTDELWQGGSLGLNLDGTGYDRLGIWDGGKVRTTHQEFNNTGTSRVIPSDGASTLSNHATHVAGTMIAAGVSADAKGMASNATLLSHDWNSDDSEMSAAAANGLELSNHSYSYIHGWSDGVWHGDPSVSTSEDYWFGFYSSYTRDWDQIGYDAPYYLIVKSAGNDRNDSGDGTYPPDGNEGTGYDCIGTTGIAKNILTVGSVLDVLNYTGPASVTLNSFSSCGPADDGRIKPDIVANGNSLYSSLAGYDQDYGSYSGTSMSSPNTTGTLALLQQHYQNTHNGESMRAATLKALVVNTADECGNNPGPDYEFGWGLLNAQKAAELISLDQTEINTIDEQILTNGGSYSFTVMADGTEPLSVTVCWTDPAHTALPASLDPLTPHLVNDLDLHITDHNPTVFYPFKLDRDNPTAAATNNSENNVDNVEQVRIYTPAAGEYIVTIDHDETLTAPQYYSIVVSGAIVELPDPPVADFVGLPKNINEGQTVTFTDNSANNPTSWSWSFPGGTPSSSTSKNPEVIYSDAGTYDVSLTVSNAAGNDTKTIVGYITVSAQKPVAAFSARSNLITQGQQVTFTDLSENYPDDYSWTFEGGTPDNSTDPNPVITYNDIGTYLATLIVSNEAGSDTVTETITVEEATYCDSWGSTNDSYIKQIDADGQTISSIGDDGGYKAPSDDVELSIAANQSINVTLTPGFNVRSFHQYWTIWIDFDKDKVFEANEIVFAPAKSKGTITGSFLSGNPIGETRMRISMSGSGYPDACDYIGQGEVEDFLIFIGEAPPEPLHAQFVATPTTVTLGDPISFNDQSTGSPTSWLWAFGDGSTSTSQNPVHTYNSEGTFSVSLTVWNATGSDVQTKTDHITVNADVPPSDYCVPLNLLSFKEDYIQTIIFNQSTPLDYGGYSGYSAPDNITIDPSASSVTLVPANSKNRNYWGAWIDINEDFDFYDSGETLFTIGATRGTATASFTLLTDADGKRLRIAMRNNGAPTPCGDDFYGEVKDFTINLAATATKSGTVLSLEPIHEEFFFQVYPNPASGKVFIQTSGWDGEKEVKILNIIGQSVYMSSHGEKLIEIDISTYPKGIYLLHVSNSNNARTAKLQINN